MCDRPKIHVFLGAPPPSSGPASAAGLEGEEPPPAGWRHLELTWQDGRLRLATDGAGNEEDGGISGEISEVDRSAASIQNQDDETNNDPGESSSKADWTMDPSRALKERAKSGCKLNDDKKGKESNSGKEDQCSASIHEFLDSCFPTAQSEPETTEPGLSPAAPPLSVQTQYLTTWTLSQALILRGRCGIQSATSTEKTLPPQTPPTDAQTPPAVSSSSLELFSPVIPPAGGSAELFSQPRLTPPAEEGGIIIEATSDGVLCYQKAQQQESTTAQTSRSKSPEFKTAPVLESRRTEVSVASLDAVLRGPTTLLNTCDKRGMRYSVLVAVVHPCHLKEVKLKSGLAAGTFVPLASIVVTDQSGVEMKVVLWRRAAFWALTVSPGDILLITALQVNEDRWRGETVLQSTFNSKLLNLGPITASTSPPAPQQVDAHSLSSLCGFLRERHPPLVSLNISYPQDLNRLPYATLRSLRVNTLVHALLRVTHTHISTAWRSEAESRCRSAVQLKALVTVEQPDGQQGVLLLWGAAVDWLPRFRQDKAAVWDFHVLLVRDSLITNLPELHSTPWSSVRPLDPASRQAQDFLRPRPVQTGNSSLELDLDTLLSQKYSGDVELRVQVTAFHFQDSLPSQNAPQHVLDSSTLLDGILEVLSGDITYTGCGRCCTELDTDANGIYVPCYPCLPHTAVRRYYRPGVLTVSGQGNTQVCIQVPPVLLQKILEAPPDRLHKSSAPGSQVKHIQVAAEKIQSLLSLPAKIFIITVRSHFLCDENSVPIDQDFTLLDLQFPS